MNIVKTLLSATILLGFLCHTQAQTKLESNQTLEEYSNADNVRIRSRFLYDSGFRGGQVPVARIQIDQDTGRELSRKDSTDFDPLTQRLTIREVNHAQNDAMTTYMWDQR